MVATEAARVGPAAGYRTLALPAKGAAAGRPDAEVLGVDHRTRGAEAAARVLEAKPKTVVVETAFGRQMGSATGTAFSIAQLGPGGGGDPLCKSLVDAAKFLNHEPNPVRVLPQLEGNFTCEQIAFAAALSVDARIVFGDRPKDVTMKRLVSADATELDAAYGKRSCLNYLALLGEDAARDLPASALPSGATVYDRVMLEERERVMLHTLAKEMEATDGPVMSLVGLDHLDGMAAMWEEGAGAADVQDLLGAPQDYVGAGAEDQAAAEENYCLKRSILEGLLAITCAPDVINYANQVLRNVADNHYDTYELVSIIYQTPRMLLATCPPELLAKVFQGRDKGDIFAELEPYRQARPLHGGNGFSDAVVDQIVGSAIYM